MNAIPPGDERTVVMSAPLSPNALALGTRLGEFELVGLVGEGGFGIVYLAYDHSLDRKVALKEYMPSALANREGGSTVLIKSPRHAETFDAGLRSFVNEARLLAQFDHPSLVKVYRFWEANGTVYMVMPFYEGLTLKQALRARDTRPGEAWLLTLLGQLLDALEIIHSRQCYHRDIAPDNVLMVAGGTPVLLDFGAARRVVSDMTQALTVILKPGYAPIEQYAETPNMKQGAWTDIYALASMVYFAITGRAPEPAVSRVMSDPVVPLVECEAGNYSEIFLAAIDGAMAVKPEDRPQTIAEFRDALGIGALQPHPALRDIAPPAGGPADPARATQASAVRTQPPTRTTPSVSPTQSGVPEDSSIDIAELERLLARYIGPMAKIILGRARKTGAGGLQLVESLAASIDDEADQTAFVAAARKLVRK